MATASFRVWRGDREGGAFETYSIEVDPGMVVLDAVHRIQAEQVPDLAVRWNCKAGKCGSCSAEINGMPKLMCMTRLDTLPIDEPITVEPMKAFPAVKDLVTDVSWNFEVKRRIKPFKPRPPDAEDGTWRMDQADVDRVQEFRKCIECYLCQDVCHVLRDHHKHDEFIGPRFLVYTAALEMHPLDTEDRLADLRERDGVGYCNITKCCTKVCPEHITITDNAIIPLKERVVDEFYDPVRKLFRIFPSQEGVNMHELKPIHADAIPAALEKAERYRLLNEPREAESICRDVLHVDRDNHDAIVTLLLALTDQFGKGMAVTLHHAEEILPRLPDGYERQYYAGVIFERWAKVQLEQGAEGHTVHDWFRRAMDCFEASEAMSPTGNDDAILRRNTCVRLLKRNPQLRPREQDESIRAGFEDEVPFR